MKLKDLVPDPHNANKGTERGRAMLEDSLKQYGAGRSILVDKHGRVIAGNKTLETAIESGFDEVEVIQTDGKKIIAVQRVDLDLLKDDSARQLAYADNRTSEIDLDWDADKILEDLDKGIDLDVLFYDWELEQKLNTDGESDFGGLPAPNEKDVTSYRRIIVHFENEEDVQDFAKLLDQSITSNTQYLHVPRKKKEKFRTLDES